MKEVWEDLVSLNSHGDHYFEVLDNAEKYRASDTHTDWTKEKLHIDLDLAASRDLAPLPLTKDREGYFGPHHFSYWASGLRDVSNMFFACERLGVNVQDYLDLGCSSGRLIRHMAFQHPEICTWGCDINAAHVAWVTQFLPDSLMVFQNHSLPTLPLPDESIDLVSAFSVFTHIEAFETAWLMELRRILRPGGLAWVTVHTEKTWEDMNENWPLYGALKNHPEFQKIPASSPMPRDRMVFRWRAERSYSSNVFYSYDYIRKHWARYLDIVETHRRLPVFQDVIVMRKPFGIQ
ncbi:class I SAM-dependent methyltransferase [Fodinicurvata halophila]|uniref:Class I SAM-dependent methyltransferase n=1 Tax=Fodinicurvata halophila TaxID=1419723 RepID=A0ABV8UP99_9PROT